MTDESVDVFYSCLLCQSFAPNHVCIITPERLGLCGAYNWLDGKAAYEIDETGANQPVKKQQCYNAVKGAWEGVNNYVFLNSHKAIENLNLYSIMEHPMTSCGCFEAICAYVPECNGIMIVNREFPGDTPVGMTFSTLAGNVGGGQQIPGFMGIGKVYITSKKFISTEGGFKRVIWMPRELKKLLDADLKARAIELEIPDLIDKIADESIATDPKEIRQFLEKVQHPALKMPDMAKSIEFTTQESPSELNLSSLLSKDVQKDSISSQQNMNIGSKDTLSQINSAITTNILKSHNISLSSEVVQEIVEAIQNKLSQQGLVQKIDYNPSEKNNDRSEKSIQSPHLSTLSKINEIQSFKVRKETNEVPIWTVTLGATHEQGGTRKHNLTIGGSTCMPFHLWEGDMPHRPLVAMEVFDVVSEKCPKFLHTFFGDILNNPVEMAKKCVQKYGADLISIRLEGTHPEKGNRTAEQAVALVKAILAAVDVPLIITGHNHFEKINEVFKAIAKECAGENLLFNWVEQNNYTTIASVALAYGHSIVAQSPIDINIAKQLNILLTNMNVKPEKIVMDPMTGALGYGMEYTYSVMERIRLTALNGDKMLAGPMIVSPGQECAKAKEIKAEEDQFPSWGDLSKRSYLWELATAMNFLHAGADILIMYHPEAVQTLKQTISKLLGELTH
jgi:CO dehydrogenase/acetyl-CoA synthase delta subunit